jgi:methionyl aminopeptidase
MQTRVKTADEITAMRESGRLHATVMATLKEAVAPGISTKDLAELAKRELRGTGGTPTFLGYPGPVGVSDFPDVACISLNDEIVHGIPRSDKLIAEGDLVSVDFGVTFKGMITDGAFTVIAGKPQHQTHQDLVRNTEKAMLAGIAMVRGGVRVGDIAHAIEKNLKDYGIVEELVGHGVGHELHEDPNIPNYGPPSTGMALSSGMTIAIEPMATIGDAAIAMDSDGWTIRTRDGSLSAHFEHTVLITDTGAEILTTL